jgi:WD40 repeat protein
LARAIHFAHEEQVVHRDLKPSNVLLDPPDVGVRSSSLEPPLALVAPKITDFGLAKLLDSDQERTRQGQLLGTPSYAPPEQLLGLGEQAGPATDIYSLGAILYELLTGRAPFQGEDVWQTVQQVQHDEPLSPRLLNPSVPRDLETICLKCLEKSPASRYPSAAALADDLDRYCAFRPIVARPLGWSERALRWARRNRSVAGLLAIVTLLVATVVAGSVGSARYFYLLERQEKELQQKLQAQQKDLQQTSEDKSQALADSYRALGLAAGQNGRPHLAALYFAHAAGETRDLKEDHSRSNAVRARHFLARCAIPLSMVDRSGDVRLDDVVFHPSGQWLVSQPYERYETQDVHDVTTGERLPWPKNWGRVTAAVWNATGDRIFVGTDGGQVLEAEFPGCEVLWAHRVPAGVRALAVSRQQTALSVVTETEQWIWNRPGASPDGGTPGDWQLVGEWSVGETHPVDLLFDPWGRWCLCWTRDQWLTARRATTGEPGARVRFGLKHYDWSRIRPQFDVEGRLVVWSDFELSRVDLDRNEQVPIGRADGGYSFEVSPHDGTILVGGNFRALLYTATGAGRINGTTTYSACWLENGTALLGATEGDMLYQLDVQRQTMTPWPLFQSDGAIRLRLSPDGRRLATISNQSQLRIWQMPGDPGDGLVRVRIPTAFESDWGELSRDETLLLVRRFGVNAQLHQVSDGTPCGPPLVPEGRLQDALWLPDGENVLTLSTSRDATRVTGAHLDVWRGRTGERECPTIDLDMIPRKGEESPHALMAVSPRGDRVAVVEEGLNGLAWIELKPTARPFRRIDIRAEWVLNLPQVNGLLVSLGSQNGESSGLLQLDWETGEITRRFPIRHALGGKVSPDGLQVALGTRQSEVLLLDLTGQRDAPICLPHPNWAVPDSYTRDGRHLVTRGKDRFFRVWDVRRQSVSSPISEFVFHGHSTFGALDRVLITCNMRGVLQFLSPHDGQPLAPPLSLGHRPIMPEEGGFRFATTTRENLVVVGGTPALTVFDLERFLEPLELGDEALIDWCSLVSGHHLQQGMATPLSHHEWTSLWYEFQRRHSDGMGILFQNPGGQQAPRSSPANAERSPVPREAQ